MNFSFREIIDALNANLPQSDNFAFALARAAVIPADYILNRFLPQENRPDYNVNGGSMVIWPTMLGQVPMDTPYPPMGAITSQQFFEKTTKLGGSMFFPEAQQRELDAWIQSMISIGVLDGRGLNDIFGSLAVDENGNGNVNTVNGRRLNAVLGIARSILKAHWDTYEFLRGQALFTGELDWTFNQIPLKVNYRIPAAYFQTARSGNDAYGGSTSKFWYDIRWLYTQLESFILVMNQNTWLSMLNQDFNKFSVVVNDGLIREVIPFNTAQVQQNPDRRDRARIYVYNKSGTVINGQTGELQALPFVPDGKILAVGTSNPEGYELLAGSVDNPDDNLRLGYTHIAPTVEGGSRPGIWARIYTPEGKPMQVLAETAVNMLPAILNPRRMRILTTTV